MIICYIFLSHSLCIKAESEWRGRDLMESFFAAFGILIIIITIDFVCGFRDNIQPAAVGAVL